MIDMNIIDMNMNIIDLFHVSLSTGIEPATFRLQCIAFFAMLNSRML